MQCLKRLNGPPYDALRCSRMSLVAERRAYSDLVDIKFSVKFADS